MNFQKILKLLMILQAALPVVVGLLQEVKDIFEEEDQNGVQTKVKETA